MQFIVSKKEFIPPVIAPDIIETLGDDYEIWTYEDYERLPPLKRGEIRKQAKTLISSRFKDSGQTGYK